MEASVSMEVRCKGMNVHFQAIVQFSDANSRHWEMELAPGKSLNVRLGIPVSRIAMIAGMSMYSAEIDIDGCKTVLEGQHTSDFGLLYCVRGDEEFGMAPFEAEHDGILNTLVFRNTSDKKNTIRLIVAELPDEPEPEQSPNVQTPMTNESQSDEAVAPLVI